MDRSENPDSVGSQPGTRTYFQAAIPATLLAGLILVVWLSVFVGNDPERAADTVPEGLEARESGQFDGIDAARIAIRLAKNAVENRQPGDDGLLSGDLERVRARYEPRGTASSWTVAIEAPIRSRPNTPSEFRIDQGMIVIELSAFTGEVSGHFSAGRAFAFPASGSGFLNTLGISPVGFVEVPLDLVLPPIAG